MVVKIRSMVSDEFETVQRWSIKHHAAELMEELHMSEEEAIAEATLEFTQLLPDGIHTKHNHLMTIVEAASDETVGFIWTLHEEFQGRKQSFICDFAIWESKRRRGYAAAALYLAEKNAAEAGCQESVLFVRDDNTAARALYEKSGYIVLRQKDSGKFMKKQICDLPPTY